MLEEYKLQDYVYLLKQKKYWVWLAKNTIDNQGSVADCRIIYSALSLVSANSQNTISK